MIFLTKSPTLSGNTSKRSQERSDGASKVFDRPNK